MCHVRDLLYRDTLPEPLGRLFFLLVIWKEVLDELEALGY